MLREIDALDAGFEPLQIPLLVDAYAKAMGVVEKVHVVDESVEARLARMIMAEARRRLRLGLGLRHRYDATVVATMAAGFLFHVDRP